MMKSDIKDVIAINKYLKENNKKEIFTEHIRRAKRIIKYIDNNPPQNKQDFVNILAYNLILYDKDKSLLTKLMIYLIEKNRVLKEKEGDTESTEQTSYQEK